MNRNCFVAFLSTKWLSAYLYTTIREYNKYGPARRKLVNQINKMMICAHFLDIRGFKGLTMARYLKKKETKYVLWDKFHIWTVHQVLFSLETLMCWFEIIFLDLTEGLQQLRSNRSQMNYSSEKSTPGGNQNRDSYTGSPHASWLALLSL